MSLFMCVGSMIFMDGDFQVVLVYRTDIWIKTISKWLKMMHIDEQKQLPVVFIHSNITDKVHEYIADHVLLPKLRKKSNKNRAILIIDGEHSQLNISHNFFFK